MLAPFGAGTGGLLHFINQRKHNSLLVCAQPRPAFQQLPLGLGQRNRRILLRKQLRQRYPECCADLFQRRDGWHHIFPIPGGDSGLGQTGTLCKLILCPASLLSVFRYRCKNVFHSTHPYACTLRKLYFDRSLIFNTLCRIIITKNTTKGLWYYAVQKLFLYRSPGSRSRDPPRTVSCY